LIKGGIKMSDSKSNVEKMELLDEWLEELVYPGKSEDFIHHTKGYGSPDGETYREFSFYTDEYRYRIVAIDRPNDDGYLGCQTSTRKFRPGEDWHRGNDLPDGPFVRDTWDNILKGIVKYELVLLSKHTKPIVEGPTVE